MAITDVQGLYSFPDLPDGTWKITVDMFGFEPSEKEVAVAPNAPAAMWELKLLPLARIRAAVARPATVRHRPRNRAPSRSLPMANSAGAPPTASSSTAASTMAPIRPSPKAAAFGNNRFGGKSLYNGGIGITVGNSALDARPFSLTGQNTPKADYRRTTGFASLGGPLRIPHLLRNGPNVFLSYQWTRNNDANTASALMPSQAERNGRFSTPVRDPLTGVPFPGNIIPQNRISPQALALLGFYPLPNFDGGSRYNYQIPIVGPTHQDACSRASTRRSAARTRSAATSRFRARARTARTCSVSSIRPIPGVNTAVNWMHRFNQRVPEPRVTSSAGWPRASRRSSRTARTCRARPASRGTTRSR